MMYFRSFFWTFKLIRFFLLLIISLSPFQLPPSFAMEEDLPLIRTPHKNPSQRNTLESESGGELLETSHNSTNIDRSSQLDTVGSEDEELLIKALTPFLKWMESSITEQERKTTKLTKAAGAAGFGIGLLAAYASFPLSGDFAVLVSEAMGINDPIANKIIYTFSGINAAIPSMALNSIATRHQFQSLVSPSLESDSLFPSNKKLKAMKVAAHFLGVFSAMSSGYVGYLVSKDFPTPFTALFTTSAYVGCYMFTVESQKRLSKALVNYLGQNKESRYKREKLQEALIKSMKAISKMQEEDFNQIYEDFFAALETQATGENHQASLKKIKSLLKMGQEREVLALRSKCNNITEKAVEIVGSVIGAAETYVAFALVDEATQFLCDSVGIYDSSTKTYLSKTFATLACVPWGSLDIEGVKGRFVRMYNSLFNKDRNYQKEFVKPTVRKSISRFAIWGGISSAIPPTYLAIKTTKGLPLGLRIILSGATFLCPATVLTEALETMLDQGWSWVKSFRKDSIELHKEKLIQTVQSIALKINELPDSTIDSLYDEVLNK